MGKIAFWKTGSRWARQKSRRLLWISSNVGRKCYVFEVLAAVLKIHIF